MAAAPRSRSSTFTPSEQWLLMTATILVCGFLGYVVYDAIMATASELLQRLLGQSLVPSIELVAHHGVWPLCCCFFSSSYVISLPSMTLSFSPCITNYA
ncbi:hypothetical protein SCA6_011030 [Theobroma cacao]